MGEIIQGLGKAFGGGLAVSLGKTLVFVVVAFMFFMLASVVFGLLFLGLSFWFYKSHRPGLFLIFGILSVMSISIFASIILSSSFTSDLTLAVILFPAFLIFGITFVIKKYKRIRYG